MDFHEMKSQDTSSYYFKAYYAELYWDYEMLDRGTYLEECRKYVKFGIEGDYTLERIHATLRSNGAPST
jgi:hypothetical protein